MFCSIATTIERCKTEGVVDVFQVVKALRVQKPGAVLTVVSSGAHMIVDKKISESTWNCKLILSPFLFALPPLPSPPLPSPPLQGTISACVRGGFGLPGFL